MKNLITIITIVIVFLTSGLKANNVTPENSEMSQKTKELVTKIDRNVMAMELMFTDKKTSSLKKKTLYHRYWIVMMDFRHKLKEGKTDEEVEKIKNEIHDWNLKIMQLLNTNTENLEKELSTIIEVEEIKKIVLS